MALSKELLVEEWNLRYTRRRILALLCPCTNSFLSTKSEDTPFWTRDMWIFMMRLYLGCFVYDDSAALMWLRCD